MRACRSSLPVAAVLGLANVFAVAADPPPGVVINEIMYHPAEPNAYAEFVELHNAGAVPVDLSSWRFTRGVLFTFSEGTVIPGNGYLLLCRDASSFTAVYGAGLPVAGQYAHGLSNSGEGLLLADSSGRTMQEVDYLDEPPWPSEADGAGASLELVDPALDIDDPYSWKASVGGPTPGRVNSVVGERLPLSMADAHHIPDRPQPGTEVVVTVRVNHTAPVASVELVGEVLLQNDNAGSSLLVSMRDDGVDSDAAAGDGVWSCRLPGQPALTLVRYTFLARDANGVTAAFPHVEAATPNRAYFVADYNVPAGVSLWWLVMTPQALSALDGHVFTDDLEPAAFVSETGKVYDRIGVRYRGFWARYYAKKSWKLAFNGDRLFRGQKRLNLNATMYDPAGLRERFAYEVFKDVGALYCDTEMVRVHFSRPSGAYSPFLGLFTAVEQTDARWARRMNRDGAVVYKSAGNTIPNSGDERYEPDPAAYAANYEKETHESEPWDDFIGFTRDLDQLFGADEAAIRTFFQARVNLPTFYRWLVGNACLQNWDSFNKNHFMVLDVAGSGKWEMAPWDCDRTLGDMWGGGGYDAYTLTPFLGREHDPGTTGWNRVTDRFFAVTEFRAEFLRQLNEVLATVFREELWWPRIDAQAAAAAAASDLDDLKWGGDWTAGVAEMKQYVTNRRSWLLQNYFPTTLPETPVNVAPADEGTAWRLPFTLTASPFVHPEGGVVHYSSRWQIAREGDDWSSAIVDIVSQTALTSFTVTHPVFEAGARYRWRVAYLAFGRGLSAWSAPSTLVLKDLGYLHSALSLGAAANVDVVLNAGDGSNVSFDNVSLFLIENGYLGGDGLPASGRIGEFVLGDYNGANAVRCNRRGVYRYDAAIAVPPARYMGLEFLAAASPGDAQVQVRLAYQDGSVAYDVVQADDWCDDTPERGQGGSMSENVRQAIDGMDRYGAGGLENINDVGLFVCHVPADPAKILQSVTLQPGGTESWWFNSDFTQWNLLAIDGVAAVSTVNFEAVPVAGTAPLTVGFANRSYGSDITGYLWSFGDGQTSAEVSPTHQYSSPGRFTVTLTAQRSAGGPLVAEERALILVDGPITVDFSGNVTGGDAPLSVAFTNLSTGASIQGYRWEFGDGATSDLRHPMHVYAAPGEYTVVLTVFGYGVTQRLEKSGYVRAFAPAVADFAADTRTGDAPLTVRFTNLSQGESLTGFLWNFGDGGMSLERDPVHRYEGSGVFSVRLTVFTSVGEDLVVEKTDYVVVRIAPAFLRGDPNEDTKVDLSDAVSILRMLFAGRPLPPCEDRLDANDDGELSIADAVRVLSYLFAGGAALPAPFPVEGSDQTGDALRCEE
jgi:PKD repeat protein/spore coat protein CotH